MEKKGGFYITQIKQLQDRIFENKTIPYHLGWCGVDVTFSITYLVYFYGK